jgi:gamma-glutamyltranspeptidase/glutathione hydrolase
MGRIGGFLAVCGLSVISMNAQDRAQARSMVISRHGIVATSQTLASQAGAMVLARGGSAMDAAIAANAVLGVVEPMSNGIGGDLFAIYWDAKAGKLTGINASGWSPKALTPVLLRSKGILSMPEATVDSVTVPGWKAAVVRSIPRSDLLRRRRLSADGDHSGELGHQHGQTCRG